uniref:Reverse transcriptase domain-containing protein n=1 Tax=Fagus sylvatica TaxID=28930 RepID=A0A2N9H996_FAGSY
MFCRKYFQAEEKVTLVNLHGTKQGNGEDLLKYIHRFHDMSLDCYANYEESELVGICIDNMSPEFRAHLENLDITRFAQLLQKARKTALSIKPQVEKTREKKNPPQVLTISAGDSKRRKEFGDPPAPVPCTKEEMIAILNRWMADGVIKLPEVREEATKEEKRSPKYCHFHRCVKHSTTDCWSLRRRFHAKIQDGTLELPQAQQRVHTDPFLKHKGKATVSVIIHGRLNPEAWTTATEAIMSIAAESGTHCFTVEAHASYAFLETTNAITFTDEDMDVPYLDHRRPLYLAATINEVQVRRALVDMGSVHQPYSSKGAVEYTKGHIQLVLRVGPIIALTRFHVIDSVVPYHVLLGRPWLHKHQLISSTYHQCEKGRLNGKPIRIAVNPTPFDQSESHFVEKALYDEIIPVGEASLFKPIGTPLPKWEDIRDDPEVDLRELLEPKKKRKEEVSTSRNQPQCVRVKLPDEADSSKLADAGKSAVTKEPTAADPKISAKEELEEYQDVFAWQYNEMPEIDPTLVAYSLNVEPGAKPMVQPMRTFHPKVEEQISQEVKKLLSAGFIKPIQHPRKYNQIFMSPKDVEKIAFCTPIGNFYYTVMSFSLKNARTTYQRMMTAMYHDMMHHKIEDYVDDIVVKSKKREDHFAVLRKVFERCCLYKLKMNPFKCAFGVTAGKFLGFLVHQHGIDLSQYEIITETSTAIKSQAIADLLAQFPEEDNSFISDEVPGEVDEVLMADLADATWTLRFDGSSTAMSSGVGIVLSRDDGEAVPQSFKLDFPCSNNVMEYEAYLTRLAVAWEMGIKHLKVVRDSNLIVKPITNLLKREFEESSLNEEDWRMPLKAKLMSPVAAADFKEIKDYTLISGELYHRLLGGVLARCISIQEAKRKLIEVHEKTCEGGGGISLYRKLQRLGYYWPNMGREAVDLQSQCLTCQLQHDNEEVYVTFASTDWRIPFLEYFLEGILPQTHKEVYHLKRLASRYFVEGETLFRKGYHGEPLRCLSLSKS